MKNRFALFAPLAAFVLAVTSGCGGSGSTTGGPIAVGNREAIAKSILGASTTSSAMKAGGRSRSRTEAARPKIQPVVPGKLGSAQTASRPIRRDEGDLVVGGPVGVSPDLWGRVTAVEYAVVGGYRGIAVLNFDIFDDPDYTNLVGYDHVEIRTVGEETTYRLNSKFTKGRYVPRDYRVYTLNNSVTGRSIQEFSDSGREEISPGVFRDSEYSSRWDTPGFGQPTTFVGQFKQDGLEYNTSGTTYPDGRFEMVWVNAAGYTIRWESNPDLTGSFRIENINDALCPATGSYDAEGKGILTFADGTTAEFDLYNSSFWR